MRRCAACGFDTKLDPRTGAYHRAHRANHLEVFPNVDKATRSSLDTLVRIFEQREAGDTVTVDDGYRSHTGAVVEYRCWRHAEQWTVECDDGMTIIVNDRCQIALTDARLLPMVCVGGRWRLDVSSLMSMRERGVRS